MKNGKTKRKKRKMNTHTHEIGREKSEIIHMKITIYMHVKSCTRFHDGARYPSTTVVQRARTKSAVVPSSRRTSTHYADGGLYTNMVVASPYLLWKCYVVIMSRGAHMHEPSLYSFMFFSFFLQFHVDNAETPRQIYLYDKIAAIIHRGDRKTREEKTTTTTEWERTNWIG